MIIAKIQLGQSLHVRHFFQGLSAIFQAIILIHIVIETFTPAPLPPPSSAPLFFNTFFLTAVFTNEKSIIRPSWMIGKHLGWLSQITVLKCALKVIFGWHRLTHGTSHHCINSKPLHFKEKHAVAQTSRNHSNITLRWWIKLSDSSTFTQCKKEAFEN